MNAVSSFVFLVLLFQGAEASASSSASSPFEQAIAHYEQGDFDQVLRLLKDRTSPTPEERLLGAYALIQLGRNQEGQTWLSEVARDSKASAPVRQEAQQMLEQLGSDEKTDSLSLQPATLTAEISVGHASNVHWAAQTSSYQDVQEVSSAAIHAEALLNLDSFEVGVTWDEPVSVPEERNAMARFAYEFSALELGSFELLATPFGKLEWMQNQPSLLKPGLRLVAGPTWGSNSLALTLELQRNLSLSSDFDDRRGYNATAVLSYSRSGTVLGFDGFAGVTREKTEDFREPGVLLPLAYRAILLGGGVKWKFHPSWTVAFQPTWSWRYYDARTIPHDIRRIDLFFAGILRVDFALTDNWSFFASGTGILNQSSLGAGTVANRNFGQLRSSSGLSWSKSL